MSYYRIWRYPLKKKACKHIYFKRNRPWGHIPHKKGEKPDPDSPRAESNLIRARSNIRNIILCNKFEFFCTFTFNEEKIDRHNFKVCKKRISELFKNYKNRYSTGFRYLIIPEFHRDGAVHFHGMVSGIAADDLTVPTMIWKRDRKTDKLSLVPNTKNYVDWPYYSKKLGFFSCSAVKNYEACAKYVSKYITKGMNALPRGVDLYMCSKGLARPELVFDCDDLVMPFKPDYQDDFVLISDQTDNVTIDMGFMPPWYGECCSDLQDPIDQLFAQVEEEEPLFPRMSGAQLTWWRQRDAVSI